MRSFFVELTCAIVNVTSRSACTSEDSDISPPNHSPSAPPPGMCTTM